MNFTVVSVDGWLVEVRQHKEDQYKPTQGEKILEVSGTKEAADHACVAHQKRLDDRYYEELRAYALEQAILSGYNEDGGI